MANMITIYAPISAGLSGQILMSNGEGCDPSWIDNTGSAISAHAAIQLNGGSQQIVGGMVIPEGYGISGQVLRSNGPDVFPSWQQPAEGSQLYLNGSAAPSLTAQVYAPISSGTPGQVLASRGQNNEPVWQDQVSVQMNGSETPTTSASFYAPLSSGTSGQFLISNGSGLAPSWQGFSRVQATNASGVSGTVIIHKCGKFCIAYIGGIIPPGSSTTVTIDIATAPSGYGASEFTCAAIMTNYGGNPSLVSISGNTFKVWGATPTKGYYGCLVYPTP